MTQAGLSKYLAAETLEDQQTAYDTLAEQYERDLLSMGYRLHSVVAAVFARFVSTDVAPILDAGCGGGLQAEPLATMGYGPIVGIDLSQGMLSVAKRKGIYADLRQMKLGDRLDFLDHSFGAVMCCGTITPRHAPADSFDELIRVAKSGALIVFSLRDDEGQEPEYPRKLECLERERRGRTIYRTANFRGMPHGDLQLSHRVFVFEVAA